MDLPTSKNWYTWDENSFAGVKYIPAGFSVVPAGEKRLPGKGSKAENINFYDADPLDILFEHEKNGLYTHVSIMQDEAVISIEYFKLDDRTVMGRIKALDAPENYMLHLAFGFDGQDATLSADEEAKILSGNRAKHFLSIKLQTVPDEHFSQDAKFIASYKMTEGRNIDFGISFSYDQNVASENALSAVDALSLPSVIKERALKNMPILRTSRYDGALERIVNLTAWADVYDPLKKLFYTTSKKLDNASTDSWSKFLADLSFQVLMNTIAGDYYMAESTLNMLLRVVQGEDNVERNPFEASDWTKDNYPPVLGYCLLMSSFYADDTSMLKKAFPVLMGSNRWVTVSADEVNSLQCIDTDALARIAGILGNENVADEMNLKAETLINMYKKKLYDSKKQEVSEGTRKTVWDYLWLRRERQDEEAREFADRVIGYYENDEFSRTSLPSLIWLMEHFSIDPWNGISFGTTMEENFVIQNIMTPLGKTKVIASSFGTELYANDNLIFVANFKGRFTNFVYNKEYMSVEINNKKVKKGYVTFSPHIATAIRTRGRSTEMQVSIGRYKIEIIREAEGSDINVIPI